MIHHFWIGLYVLKKSLISVLLILFHYSLLLLLSHARHICDPLDCSSPGSSVHGIFQARILEWVAISLFRGSSQTRDWTHVSCTDRWILHPWAKLAVFWLFFKAFVLRGISCSVLSSTMKRFMQRGTAVSRQQGARTKVHSPRASKEMNSAKGHTSELGTGSSASFLLSWFLSWLTPWLQPYDRPWVKNLESCSKNPEPHC